MTFNKMKYIQIDDVYDIFSHVLSLQAFFYSYKTLVKIV